ncbi:MAG: hypothetical protein ACR2J6_06785 [Thermoleophilaceae bacterium]
MTTNAPTALPSTDGRARRRARGYPALIGLLAFLTINVIIRNGFDILVLVSLVILAAFSFGVVGALIHRPEE